MRDRQLDIYRALLMMHIPCVAHNAYWLGNAVEPYRSFVLLLIAQAFFISGSAMSLRKSKITLWGIFVNRFKRSIAPFYIYAAVMLGGIGVLSTLLLKGTKYFRLLPFDVTAYSWQDVLDVILCWDLPHCPFMAHLWFIPVYIILYCSLALQTKVMKYFNRYVYLAMCVVLFLLVQGFTNLSFLRELLCYNVFTVTGYLFYKRDKERITAIIGFSALALILANEFIFGGHFVPLQDHKFPPDWIYLSYCVMILSFLSLVFRRITFPYNTIFRIWNERGYTIYLYQSLVLWFVYGLHQTGLIKCSIMPVNFILDLVLVFVLSTALSYVTYPFEKWVMRKAGLAKPKTPEQQQVKA